MSSGRLLALGDVHGGRVALETVLRAADLQPNDTVIGLGDYVDRGPDSRGVIERLITLLEAGRFLPLRGNHELMFCRARNSLAEERFWRQYGGDEAIASYAPPARPGRLGDVPDRHWRFLATECRDWHETDRHLFVHAGLDPRFPMTEQLEHDLFWRSLTDRGPHVSGKTVICGHTTQSDGRPLHLGHTICIDTGAGAGAWLTLLDVHSLDYWQATDRAATRSGSLRGS